jgi:hypothetical protein
MKILLQNNQKNYNNNLKITKIVQDKHSYLKLNKVVNVHNFISLD